MPVYSKVFSNRLKSAMKIRNMKQSELSALTGIYRGTISNYVTGKYIPKEDKMDLISRALNVNKGYLYGVTDNVDRLEDSDDISLNDWLADGIAQINASYKSADKADETEDMILEKYRAADEKTRKAVRVLLDME